MMTTEEMILEELRALQDKVEKLDKSLLVFKDRVYFGAKIISGIGAFFSFAVGVIGLWLEWHGFRVRH